VAAEIGFYTKIAGVSHNNPDGTPRQSIIKRCRSGETLRLVREPSNPYDSDAVKVLRQNGEQLGYIPGHVVATGLAHDMDTGTRFKAVITDITGGGVKTFGVNIQITETKAELPVPTPNQTAPINLFVYFACAALLIVAMLVYLGMKS
jgi:hypothetical protein